MPLTLPSISLVFLLSLIFSLSLFYLLSFTSFHSISCIPRHYVSYYPSFFHSLKTLCESPFVLPLYVFILPDLSLINSIPPSFLVLLPPPRFTYSCSSPAPITLLSPIHLPLFTCLAPLHFFIDPSPFYPLLFHVHHTHILFCLTLLNLARFHDSFSSIYFPPSICSPSSIFFVIFFYFMLRFRHLLTLLSRLFLKLLFHNFRFSIRLLCIFIFLVIFFTFFLFCRYQTSLFLCLNYPASYVLPYLSLPESILSHTSVVLLNMEGEKRGTDGKGREKRGRMQ